MAAITQIVNATTLAATALSLAQDPPALPDPQGLEDAPVLRVQGDSKDNKVQEDCKVLKVPKEPWETPVPKEFLVQPALPVPQETPVLRLPYK